MALVLPTYAQMPTDFEIHLFSAGGSCLHKFRVCHETHRVPKAVVAKAIYWENGHVFVASLSVGPRRIALPDVDVSIYTEDGNLVHDFAVNLSKKYRDISGITKTSQGRIAFALCDFPDNLRGEILVL